MAAKYNFPTIKTGDTFRERQVRINLYGEPADLTDATVTMHLKYTSNGPIIKDMDPFVSGEGTITIPSFKVDFQAGIYLYDLEIMLRDGFTLTYLEGKFPVEKDISR